MKKIVWDKKYNVGNETIDSQHQHLVKLINLMIDEIEIDIVLENPKVVDEIIDFLTFWLIDHILLSDKDFAPFLYEEEIL